jgi:hypothetical protein
MTSNKVSTCCYQGMTHEGQPLGRAVTLGETEAYLVGPESPHDVALVL